MTEPVRAWFDGSRALVVGLARSGVAASKLLLAHGCQVAAWTAGAPRSWRSAARELRDLGVELRFGSTDPRELEGRNLVVVSPGVPLDLPLFTEAERRGIPIVAEVELGFAVAAPHRRGHRHEWKEHHGGAPGGDRRAADRKTEVLGNIGTALSEKAESVPEEGLLVVEMSSFQLESCTRFHPRWGSSQRDAGSPGPPRNMERYAGLKARLFQFQNESEFRVQPLGDARIELLLRP